MKKFDYNGLCWWCGKNADSREHKFKKSDLINEFGGGQYKKIGGILRVTGDRDYKVEGPKAKSLKFSKNLCANCNNSKSQNFDKAYERFIDFIKSNEEAILIEKQFKLSDIFGQSWEKEIENVKKYYVKHMCCRLADGQIYIHPSIIDYLNGSSVLKYVWMKMEFMEEFITIKNMQKDSPGDTYFGIYMGEMTCFHNSDTDTIDKVSSCYQYRWHRLRYLYDRDLLFPKDNFSNNKVVLPNITGIHAYKILLANHNT